MHGASDSVGQCVYAALAVLVKLVFEIAEFWLSVVPFCIKLIHVPTVSASPLRFVLALPLLDKEKTLLIHRSF